jgi:hypothetical protein
VVQYSPNQVKQAVTGDGAADKAQVQQMVQTLLRLAARPEPPDAADAAALALTHLAFSTGSAAVLAGGQAGGQAGGERRAAPAVGPGQIKNAMARPRALTGRSANSAPSAPSVPSAPSGGAR